MPYFGIFTFGGGFIIVSFMRKALLKKQAGAKKIKYWT
jgi:chromate transport protein ChrA